MIRRIPFHPQDDLDLLLMEYAAGVLDQAHALLVSAYAALSERARQRIEDYERIGGYCVETLCAPVPMKPGSLESVMAWLEDEPVADSHATKPAPEESCPDCLRDLSLPPDFMRVFLGSCNERIFPSWQMPMPGFRAMRLPLSCMKSAAYLMNYAPGAGVPSYNPVSRPQARIIEVALVVKGAFSDDWGAHRTGDLVMRTPDEKPDSTGKACKEQGCVCLSVVADPQA